VFSSSSKCYCINVTFLIPTTSSHFFCIRLGNQEYSRSQLPTKIEKLEDWTKQPKTSCLLFFAFDCMSNFYQVRIYVYVCNTIYVILYYIVLLWNQAIQNQRNSFSRGFPLPFNVEALQAFGHFSRFRKLSGNFCIIKQKCYVIILLINPGVCSFLSLSM
jgi:hypothetical protein